MLQLTDEPSQRLKPRVSPAHTEEFLFQHNRLTRTWGSCENCSQRIRTAVCRSTGAPGRSDPEWKIILRAAFTCRLRMSPHSGLVQTKVFWSKGRLSPRQ